MPSEQIRQQLMQMMEVLDKGLKTIHPDKIKIDNNALRQKIVEAYHKSKKRNHIEILSRHKIIEDRKEYLEKLNIHREAEGMIFCLHLFISVLLTFLLANLV